MLQLTVFRCGGFTLGAEIHHSLCDGMGGTLFFNAVAESARGREHIMVEPAWEREVVESKGCTTSGFRFSKKVFGV